MASVYAYLPNVTTLHYVLPLVRYQGGIPWGREPDGASDFEGQLVDLPSGIIVPFESGHRRWERVQEALVKALGQEFMREAWERSFKGKGTYPPELEGNWLKRVGLDKRALVTPSIHEFTW